MPENTTDADAPAAPAVRRVEAVVNAASGSTGPDAAAALEAILEARALDHHVVNAQPREIADALRAAVAARPDLLIVLAGDGTARLACELAGPDGPMVAALPGGTMNMLPHALYGRLGWREAIVEALDRGSERVISGGEVAGSSFYVAAILGAPALWAPAREAVRKGRWRRALRRARLALARAFSGRLRYRVDGGPERKATNACCIEVASSSPSSSLSAAKQLKPSMT